VLFLKYKYLKLRFRVFLARRTVALVPYSVMKMIATCSPVIGQIFDTIVYHPLITSGNNDTLNSTSWKVLETALSHLN